MQHYAFCGPEYIDNTVGFSFKAQEAFGNGNVIDYRDDYLRQFCYLTYAYLDANRLELAEESLLKYLEITHLSDFDFANDANPFKHSLLVRYLADTNTQSPEYRAWALNNPCLTNRHPWQLWLFNMGRIEYDENRKKDYWQQSVEMCLDQQGETIRSMEELGRTALENKVLSAECLAKLKTKFPFTYR